MSPIPDALAIILMCLLPTSLATDGLLVPRATLSVSDILDKTPEAQCGPLMVAELYDCCGGRDIYLSPNKSLAGELPANFTPARRFTDLSNNPDLCGVIAELPQASATTVADQPPGPITNARPPLNITNTKVRLDLAKLSSDQALIAPQIALWLGDAALNASNLHRTLDAAAAYQMCTILQHSRVKIVQANYYCQHGRGNCTCSAAAQTSSKFHSGSDWDACHVTLLDLSFNSSIHQAAALAQYNSYIMSKGLFSDAAGFACGDAGWQYRRRVALLVTLVPAGACAVILALMWCCIHTRAVGWILEFLHGESQLVAKCCSERVKDKLPLVAYVILQVYDTVSDWLFVIGVARTGNAHAVMLLGWLYWGTHMALEVLLLLFTWLYEINAVRHKADFVRQNISCTRLVLVVLVSVVACTLGGMGSSNVTHFAGDASTIAADDAMFLAYLFLCFTLAGKFGMLSFGACVKARILFWKKYDNLDGIEYVKLRVVTDVLSVMFVDVPQLVTQTMLWVRGWVVLDTITYVMSAAGSTLSIMWCVVSLFTGSHYYQHKKQMDVISRENEWNERQLVMSSQLAAATRFQRELLTGMGGSYSDKKVQEPGPAAT